MVNDIKTANKVKKDKSESKKKVINEFYYNKKEIRYDKIYPELPWEIGKNDMSLEELPTRLYNIKTKEVREKEYIQPRGIKSYATLSYVWGNSELTDDEKEELKKYEQWNESLKPKSSFSSNLTPSGNKALLKAIETCNLLGIEYLWMDKICVNQEDLEEKGQEVRKMRDYYDNSTVTLVAIQADIEKELLKEWRDSFVSWIVVKKVVVKKKKAAIIAIQSSTIPETVEVITSTKKYDGSFEISETITKELDVISSEDLVISAKSIFNNNRLSRSMPGTSVWKTAPALKYLKTYQRENPEETNPEKAWKVFFSLHEITESTQQQAWKESGFIPTWSAEGRRASQADEVWEKNWKDLTINDPNSEIGQIKDWQKGEKIFTYVSYNYETKNVNFLKHDKKEIDKVHQLLISIVQETDPTKLPSYCDLSSKVNYSLVPDSINLATVQKNWKDKDKELWSPFFNDHNLVDENVQRLWKSTGLNPEEAEITYNNEWIDLTINSQDNHIGKIFNLGNKSFDYASWKQTTVRINPLIKTKTELDADHWNMAWEGFFRTPRNISDENQKNAWKNSDLNPFEEATTAYDKRNWHDLTIDSPSDEKGQIKDWNKENKTFTYTSYGHETKKVNILKHDKKQIDQVHKLLTDIATEVEPTNLPTDEFLKEITNYNDVPSNMLGLNEFNLENLQKIRDDKEQELWNPFFLEHRIKDEITQKPWKLSGLNLSEAKKTYDSGWTDLIIDSPNDAIGKISNLGKKTFDYTSHGQTTKEINPLTQPKVFLDDTHFKKGWENFFEKRNISNNEEKNAWKNSGLNSFKEAPLVYDEMKWESLIIDSPDDDKGLIENWNKEDKEFTYVSHGIETQAVKILEHKKPKTDKIHKLLIEIACEFDQTKLPSHETLEKLVDYSLVPDSRSLKAMKKIRDDKENELWSDFFARHNINEVEKQNIWKKSGFNNLEAEKILSNGWREELEKNADNIEEKTFPYSHHGQENTINPLLHVKSHVDNAYSLLKTFSEKVKIEDFIDLPEYSELIEENNYEEKKVPSKLCKSKLRKIWNEKKIGVKKNNKFNNWVEGVDSPYYSLKVIKMITNSEWFERTWTFQEGLLAKQTIFMFDNVLVDGRAMACFWDDYKDSKTIFAGTGEKLTTPIGWTYHKEYNTEDKVSLGLWEALNLVKNRKSTVAVDGLYSILGLLPYGEQVKAKYKPRTCSECPNQKESKDCEHEEKSKKWPEYSQEELKEILLEILKTAVKYGYGEPLAWIGIGDSWLPEIDANGSVKVEGGLSIKLKDKNLLNSIVFTSQSIEINGSEHVITLESMTNFPTPTVKLKIGGETQEIIGDELNFIGNIENGDSLIIPSGDEWIGNIAILVSRGEGNVRYRKGLLSINALKEEVSQQKFVISNKSDNNKVEMTAQIQNPPK